MGHTYCPNCIHGVLRYDAPSNLFYCIECEHIEVPVKVRQPRRVPSRPVKRVVKHKQYL